MREEIRDKEREQHILDEIENISEFVGNASFEDFVHNKMMKYAVYRSFTIIGEAANMLTEEYRKVRKNVEWNKIIGMRNVLMHGYYVTKNETVWETIHNSLPNLKQELTIKITK